MPGFGLAAPTASSGGLRARAPHLEQFAPIPGPTRLSLSLSLSVSVSLSRARAAAVRANRLYSAGQGRGNVGWALSHGVPAAAAQHGGGRSCSRTLRSRRCHKHEADAEMDLG